MMYVPSRSGSWTSRSVPLSALATRTGAVCESAGARNRSRKSTELVAGSSRTSNVSRWPVRASNR